MRPLEGDDFEALVLAAGGPALVVFTADWCAPCRWLTPYLTEISSEAEGRVPIFLIDVDRSPELSQQYRVASIPTVLLVDRGREVERSIGIEPERLRAWVAPFLAQGVDSDTI